MLAINGPGTNVGRDAWWLDGGKGAVARAVMTMVLPETRRAAYVGPALTFSDWHSSICFGDCEQGLFSSRLYCWQRVERVHYQKQYGRMLENVLYRLTEFLVLSTGWYLQISHARLPYYAKTNSNRRLSRCVTRLPVRIILYCSFPRCPHQFLTHPPSRRTSSSTPPPCCPRHLFLAS